MTEPPKLHRFFTVDYKGTIYFRFDTYGPEYTVWMKVDKADQVDNVDVYNLLERVYENVDLDIIKECRQTGKTRTTTKNLLEKAYHEQMTNEIDISKVLIEGDYATIMGEKYKRIEEPKSPVEEAYKDWWGEYPGTEIWTSDDEMRWVSFSAGYYNASKVSETPQEEPKSRTLKDIIWDWIVIYNIRSDSVKVHITADLLERIETKWLPCELEYDGEEYDMGWNDAIKALKDKLR